MNGYIMVISYGKLFVGPPPLVSIQDSYSLDSEDLSQTQSKGPQHRYEKGPSIHQSWDAQQEAHPRMRGTSRTVMENPETI